VKGKRINKRYFESLAAVTVTDQGSLDYLSQHGLKNVFLVRPGIDVERFTHSPLLLGPELRLMVGSAPWVRPQFKTKGVDVLLEAAQQLPRLRLVFLWRGVLTEEIERRVHAMGLEDRVEVVDRIVDVNQVLAGVHASVTLAAAPDIVKAYPHSLLESLVAGKPVLVSRAIPMASYVEEKGCGVVVEAVNPADVITAVETLEQSYVDLQTAAGRTGQQEFSQQQMIDSYKSVYEHVLASTR
jgi:glycosyltransferase involved in cell wall biosynthesis